MKRSTSYILPAIFLMILPVILFAQEINLPKTGQTTCYDQDGVIIDCTGTGQDGDNQAGVGWPSPRFTDNNDGTINDNLTGLMWLKDGNCFGTQAWQMALDAVLDLNTNPLTYNCGDYTANYSDWRLPNVVELESLVNAEEPDTALWLNTQGFTDMQSFYWSSTTDSSSVNSAGIVWMHFGSVTNNGKSESNYVFPVRTGVQSQPSQTWRTGQTTSYATGDDGDLEHGISWPNPRFEDNGDGTITDQLTGLIWLKNANCFGSETWSQALADCNNLASGSCGLSDGSVVGNWRLSNRKELISLIDYSQYSPALPQGHLFEYVQPSYYWSASNYANNSVLAWVVFLEGSSYIDRNFKSTNNYVWPVRDGNPQICKADFNDDGKVDESDLYTFSLAIGETDCTWSPEVCECDINGDDNDIDGADLGVLAVEFGRTGCSQR